MYWLGRVLYEANHDQKHEIWIQFEERLCTRTNSVTGIIVIMSSFIPPSICAMSMAWCDIWTFCGCNGYLPTTVENSMRCQHLTVALPLSTARIKEVSVSSSLPKPSHNSQRRVSTRSSSCAAEKSVAVLAIAPENAV